MKKSILINSELFNNCLLLIFIMFMILNLSMLMTFIFMKINHPLMFILLNISLTIFMSMILYFYLQTSLFSLILFIIMIGGLMIIFLYFTSLINNEKSYLPLKLILFNFLLMIMIYLIMYLSFKDFNMTIFNLNNEFINLEKLEKNNMMFTINSLYLKNYFYFYLLTIFMLMISLFNIIKICSKKNSSLRRIN
uniref:NADH dehydrogenase subunit 6 n=1 Tax=Cerceris quinquefasciata TaxID=2026451 RepID=A0A8B0JLE4_9HYME|nr:NADH dehydrogenase subunit 6 [Cerceris quinquefasciata]QTV22621.1 NADH dehydrogenase subunit 6 [Cerceris quinquefasciata]